MSARQRQPATEHNVEDPGLLPWSDHRAGPARRLLAAATARGQGKTTVSSRRRRWEPVLGLELLRRTARAAGARGGLAFYSPLLFATHHGQRAAIMSADPHTLTPFESVGPYVFGATPTVFAETLGPPERAWEDRPMQQSYEQRGSAKLAFEDDGLVQVTYGEGARLIVAGFDVFGDPAAAQKLRAVDPSATEEKQYLNLPALGLCLCGFGKRKLKEGRLAIAYAPSQRVVISFLGKV